MIQVFLSEIDASAGNAPVLDAAGSGFPVELAVVEVAGITELRAPYLLTDAVIAPDDGNTGMFLARRVVGGVADVVGLEGRRLTFRREHLCGCGNNVAPLDHPVGSNDVAARHTDRLTACDGV